MVNADEVRALLSYGPETGALTWRSTGSGRNLGQPAGTVWRGHRTIFIAGKAYQAARLAWLSLYGEWPAKTVRFVDGDSLNLRADNLRAAIPLKELRAKHNRLFQQKNPDANRRNNMKRYAGMDMREYQRMFVAQGGVCAVCKQEETATRNGKTRWLCVDHCHTTGAVRGLLCTRCNTAVGYAQDDPERLESAAAYLRRHLEKEAEVPVSNVVQLRA